MTWAVAWSPSAIRDLRDIPWRLAADVDKSVMLLADGKRPPGTLQLMIPTDPHKYRLRLHGVSVLLWVDHESRTLHVSRVLKN